MADWPTCINFLVFLILPVGLVFGTLFWALYWRKDK